MRWKSRTRRRWISERFSLCFSIAFLRAGGFLVDEYVMKEDVVMTAQSNDFAARWRELTRRRLSTALEEGL